VSRYQAYPKYKASGVEWLGEVPEHWDCYEGKRIFRNRMQKANDGDEQLAATQKYGVIPQSLFMQQEEQKVVLALKGTDGFRHVEQSDFVISLRSFQGGIEFSNYSGCVSPAYTVLTPVNEIHSNFFRYLLKSYLYIKALQSSTDSLREGKSITYSQFGRIEIPLPSLNEQTTIANFLDTQTAKIDTLIAKQQRMIALLGEKRQALVDYAINHKETINSRLCFVVDEILRPVDRAKHDLYESLGLYNRGRGIFHKPPKTDEELGDSDFYWVEEGDLILSGQFAWEGAIAIAKKSENNCIVSHRYPILRGKAGEINTEYLWAYLTTKTGDFLLNECSVGSAGRNRPLNIGTLLKEKIPVPIMSVQLEVAKIVKAEQILKVSVDKVITLLQERRSALIGAAVTGKIDVRELA
jgi:type I restriction enzyme S subunit